MRKLLLFLFIAISGIQTANSTQYESTHAIEVRRLSNWAPDYLTVTNNWDNMTYQPMTSTLRFMSVVTAINGESTKDMEEEEFYSLLNLSDQFTLEYMTKINGVNKTFTKTFIKRKGKLLSLPMLILSFLFSTHANSIVSRLPLCGNLHIANIEHQRFVCWSMSRPLWAIICCNILSMKTW